MSLGLAFTFALTSGATLAVAVIITVFLGIMNKMAKEWSRLPHFLENFGGSARACCSVFDYNKALSAGLVMGDMVLVPETILTHAKADKANRVTNTDGADELWKKAKRGNKLFVPFISETYMSFADQEKFFIPPQDAKAFVAEKMRENLKADYRLRFAAWAKGLDLKNQFGYAVTTCLFLAFFTIVLTAHYFESKWDAEEVVIYTTDTTGAVHKTVTTGVGKTYFLMIHGYSDRHDELVRGEVSRAEVLGGGIARVCVKTGIAWRDTCVFAPATLKAGTEVFLRSGEVRWNEGKSSGSSFGKGVWLITRPEAEALVATGGFKIVEK
jgi:hypothetical protein